MNRIYVSPQLDLMVVEAENLVLCASVTGGVSSLADDFLTNDLTGDDFWN